MLLQLRLIQDSPINGRTPWSIKQFYTYYIHSHLRWFSFEDKNNTKWNSTFLQLINSTSEIIHELKDVYFNRNYIFQIEFNCLNFTRKLPEYSIDFGLTWLEILNQDNLHFIPIKVKQQNNTFYRLTIPFNLITIRNKSIRFRLRFSLNCQKNYLQYIYIGNKCLMNCFGNAHCHNEECHMMNSITPLVR